MEQPFHGVPWIHLSEVTSDALDLLAQKHGFHELDVEDCRHRRQVAKVLEHNNYHFVVIKSIEYNKETKEISFHDFDLFVLPELLVTVAEGSTTVVARTQDRLPYEPEFHNAQGIAYLVIDHAVDEYLPVLDEVSEMIEEVEEEVLEKPTPEVLQKIFHLKRLLIEFRRNTTGMREVLNHLMRIARSGQSGNLPFERRRGEDLARAAPLEQSSSLYPYYRDVYDHLVRALDFIESYRDLLTGALDVYLSAVANRTNDVMKVLTIYGTISIPMVVVTGFYGMNVPLPMQESPYAPYMVIGILAGTIGLLLLFFRRIGWL